MRLLNLVKLCLGMQISLYFNSLVEELGLPLDSVEPSKHVGLHSRWQSFSDSKRNIKYTFYIVWNIQLNKEFLFICLRGYIKVLIFYHFNLHQNIFSYIIIHKLKMNHISLQKLTIATYLWTLTIVTEFFLKCKKIWKIFNLIIPFK